MNEPLPIEPTSVSSFFDAGYDLTRWCFQVLLSELQKNLAS